MLKGWLLILSVLGFGVVMALMSSILGKNASEKRYMGCSRNIYYH